MGWTIGARFPAGARYFSLLYYVQTGSGVHPASYSMSTGGSFARRKADNSIPASTEVKSVEAIPPFPFMSSWHRV
jgi:hypothetical protein